MKFRRPAVRNCDYRVKIRATPLPLEVEVYKRSFDDNQVEQLVEMMTLSYVIAD